MRSRDTAEFPIINFGNAGNFGNFVWARIVLPLSFWLSADG